MDIKGVIGEPLKIDDKTLRKELGSFARVLVDVDFTKNLPEEILIQREWFEFMTYLEYENLPAFCLQCMAVGHDLSKYRLSNIDDGTQPENRQQNTQQHVAQQKPRRAHNQ